MKLDINIKFQHNRVIAEFSRSNGISVYWMHAFVLRGRLKFSMRRSSLDPSPEERSQIDAFISEFVNIARNRLRRSSDGFALTRTDAQGNARPDPAVLEAARQQLIFQCLR